MSDLKNLIAKQKATIEEFEREISVHMGVMIAQAGELKSNPVLDKFIAVKENYAESQRLLESLRASLK